MKNSIKESISKNVKTHLAPQVDEIKEMYKPQIDDLKKTIRTVLKQHRPVDTIIADGKFQKYMVVKQATKTALIEREIYNIYNHENSLIYLVKGTFLLGKHHLILYKNKEKLGEIKKKIIVLPDIIDGYTKRHRCKVYKSDKEFATVESYVCSKLRKYKISKRGWNTSYNSDDDAFDLVKSKSVIAKLYQAYSDDARNHKYVIGYNDANDEIDIILLLISLAQIDNAVSSL